MQKLQALILGTQGVSYCLFFLESLGFLETCFPPLFSGGVLCLDHIWVFVSSWPEIL